jgi:penicillin amidase
MPEGLNPCDIPDDVLAVFTLATRSVPFTAAQRRAQIEPWDDSTIGSNNWAIARTRTTTNRPILANDPHRAHGVPSLRYIAHVSYPGLSVIGAGEPALPGISIGHNGRVAFGLTIFAMDQEDLYVYETDPAEPEAYRYRDRFEGMRIVEDSIPVRGAEPRRVTLKFTRHGPVVREDVARNRAYAIRTVWLEPGTAPYFGSVGYMRARSLDDFAAAMDGWGAPSENQVYADTDGNIALIPGGLQPNRRNWDGLFPVPGDGRYEWDGFLERDQLFARINPPEGFVHSANEMNLPRDFPIARHRVGFEWADPSRADRITEAFLQRRRWSLDDAQALQMDVLSHHARRLVPLALAAAAQDPALANDVRALQGWDFRLTADSPAAALYETWFHRFLRPAVVAATVPEPLRRGTGLGDATAVVGLIEQPDGRLPIAARDDLLRRTLRQAVNHLNGIDGPRPLPWGSVHRVRFEHPLTALLDPAMRTRTTVGPAAMQGSGFTVQAATYVNDGPGFRLTSGASFRMVIDVGNWDASRTVNAPGQSADPDSLHYRDLFEAWRTGRHVPLLYSRQAIERQTIRRIRLVPATR